MSKRKKKPELTEEQKKWNKLWQMYASCELETVNYNAYVMCDYVGGVNSVGHLGWFSETEEAEGREELNKYLSVLKTVLSVHLSKNLKKAYRYYETEDEEEVCDAADDYFFEHEQEITDYLLEAANRLEL